MSQEKAPKSTKLFIIAFVSVVVVMGAGIFFTLNKKTESNAVAVNNTNISGDKQIIEIHAKGGYQPRKSVAKAGVPTVVRFVTKGTFDCSSTISIPSMKISRSLPPSGSTDIDLGTVAAGVLQGTCGMGMYPFEIDFQS